MWCIAPVLAGCVAFILAVAVYPGARALGDTPCGRLEPGETYSVTRILDGETVVLDDGRELRLIGALAPRAVDADAEPGTWPMETATLQALRALVLGKSLALGFAGARTDRYGRLQAHAFLIEGDGRLWVQGTLIEHGRARAYALADHRECRDELLAAERGAREAGLGLWAEAAYRVRPADKPAELMRYRATFQIVEGKLLRVAQVRDTIYLNFDRGWRHAFSVSLHRDDSGLLGAYARNPRGLEGRTVRVRGWIEQRGGAPLIDLSTGGLIEVLEAPVRPDAR